MTRPAVPTEPVRRRQKSTLICDSCGYESPAQGGWIVTERSNPDGRRRESYECPVCDAVVTDRPVFRRVHA